MKERYMFRWRATIKRERLFECMISTTPFTLERSGLGTGSPEYIPRYHEKPEEKFDYIVKYMDKPIAYVDITGGPRYPPWIQMSKLEYAEKYGVGERSWIAWLDPRRLSFYFINASHAMKVEGELIRLEGEPTPYKVIRLKHWIPWRRWIEVLMNTI